MNVVSHGLPLTIDATIMSRNYKFLIDNGASISLIPPNAHLPSLRPTGISLQSASKDQINCHGELDVSIAIPQLRRTYNWTFIVADVISPILGMDFLSHHDLVVSCKKRTLTDASTTCSAPLSTSNCKHVSFSVNLGDIDSRAQSLLASFPTLTSPLNLSKCVPPSSRVFHTIDTGDHAPVHSKPRPLTGEKLIAAKAEFQFLLDSGRIRRSNSPWATPLHLVPKREPGQYRPCGDFRRLNSITTADRYPLPSLRNLTMSLHNKTVFSKVDLQRAYLQIPVHPNDIAKTAVTTPFGLFEYLFTPYGLRNAGSTFQRFMDSLFSNVPNVYYYLDDLLIASPSEEEHISDLSTVLSILSQNNLRLTIDKCEFFKPSLTFLGYNISASGIRPPTARVQAITEFPLPTNSTELRRFMGMLNFFRHMIPNFANVALPVTELLRLNPKSKSLSWSESEKDAFNQLKQSLADCPTLFFPSPEPSIYHLVTDSSSYAAGDAVYQLIDGQPHPVGFFSKKYSATQRSLSTYDRELLAAFLSVMHFKTLIDGHTVYLFTDHKPLVSAFYSHSTPKSDRQQQRLSFLSEYVAKVEYVAGRDNIVADCLSRPIAAVSTDIYDLPGIACAQLTDPEIDAYRDRLKIFALPNSLSLFCDISTHAPSPFVPLSLRSHIISFLHSLSHPSIKTTTKLVKDRFFWPSMDQSIKNYVRTCLSCQSAKVGMHTHSPIQPISSPSDRFQSIHIDIVGPLPTPYLPNHSEPLPYQYLLTCIDRATRWTEAIPLVNTCASSVAIALISGWISRFGVPLSLVTDRGSQFESELFSQLSHLIGFHHIRTTSYNPKSNGLIERFHRTLKSAIMARKANWYISLPIVLLGLRMSPNSLNFSPFTAVTGSYMLVPHPVISHDNLITTTNSTLKLFVDEMHSIDFYQFSSGDCHTIPPSYVPKDLFSVSKVWLRVDRVRRSLEAPYSGPFTVIERNPKYFILDLPHGPKSVSIDRLKPAYLPLTAPHSSGTSVPSPPSLLPPSPPCISPPDERPPHCVTPSPTLAPDCINVDQPVPSTSSSSNHSSDHSIPLTERPLVTRSGRSVKFNLRPDYKYF